MSRALITIHVADITTHEQEIEITQRVAKLVAKVEGYGCTVEMTMLDDLNADNPAAAAAGRHEAGSGTSFRDKIRDTLNPDMTVKFDELLESSSSIIDAALAESEKMVQGFMATAEDSYEQSKVVTSGLQKRFGEFLVDVGAKLQAMTDTDNPNSPS